MSWIQGFLQRTPSGCYTDPSLPLLRWCYRTFMVTWSFFAEKFSGTCKKLPWATTVLFPFLSAPLWIYDSGLKRQEDEWPWRLTGLGYKSGFVRPADTIHEINFSVFLLEWRFNLLVVCATFRACLWEGRDPRWSVSLLCFLCCKEKSTLKGFLWHKTLTFEALPFVSSVGKRKSVFCGNSVTEFSTGWGIPFQNRKPSLWEKLRNWIISFSKHPLLRPLYASWSSFEWPCQRERYREHDSNKQKEREGIRKELLSAK